MAEMPAAEISECEAAPAEAPSNTSEAAEGARAFCRIVFDG